jgi:hypothetical protein
MEAMAKTISSTTKGGAGEGKHRETRLLILQGHAQGRGSPQQNIERNGELDPPRIACRDTALSQQKYS